MIEQNPRLAAAGDNCVDWYADAGIGHPGGNPVNVAVAVARAGGRASYTGAVGDDDAGSLLITALQGEGVDTSHVRVEPGATAVTQVEIRDGERHFGHYDEGVMADFELTDEDVDFLCGHDLVVTGLWGKVESRLGEIRSRGVTVAYDCADHLDRPSAVSALPHTDICFFSAEEDSPDLRTLMADLAHRGPHTVVATLGANGSLAYRGHEFTVLPVEPVVVVDTMGAGDSYIGGFLHAHLEGATLLECMRRGSLSAAATLRVDGAW